MADRIYNKGICTRLFIHSRPQNRTLKGKDEKWPLSISLQEAAGFSPWSFICVLILLSGVFAYAAGPEAGALAPYFKVVSGDGRELSSDDVKGKVAVIFYETKDTVEKNRRLKDALNKFYDAQPDGAKKLILRIPVINCKGVIFSGVWKKNLIENSKKEGMTIYGDWDGKMFLSYGIKDADSNLIIIGRDGKVKYSFAGKIEEKDFGAIKDWLGKWTNN